MFNPIESNVKESNVSKKSTVVMRLSCTVESKAENAVKERVVSAEEIAVSDSAARVFENELLITITNSRSKVYDLMYNLVRKLNSNAVKLIRFYQMNLVAKSRYFLAFINGSDLFKINSSLLVVAIVFLALIFPVQLQAQSKGKAIGKVKTVVIDAGHGGHDPGCLGSSAREKHVCLSIALKLGKMIENYHSDVKVVYTRKEDVFVKLHERAEIANRNDADLFISIHANSAKSKSANGTETFVMGTKYTDKNLEIAKRENAVILLEDDYQNQYDGYDPNLPIMDIIAGLYQQEYLTQSINLATKVEHQFVWRNKRYSRGVKQRVLLVMYRTAMPSVLVESGFLTNMADHNLLKSKKGQLETAGAMFRAFTEYKREMEGATAEEIANEEKQLFQHWKKIYAGDSLLIKKIRPAYLHTHEEIKVEKGDEVADPDLVIRVQITSSSKKIALNSRKFSKLDGAIIKEYEENGVYKYAVGKFEKIKEAADMQTKMREKGYKDAFLVAFFKGKRVSIKKARELIKEGY